MAKYFFPEILFLIFGGIVIVFVFAVFFTKHFII